MRIGEKKGIDDIRSVVGFKLINDTKYINRRVTFVLFGYDG